MRGQAGCPCELRGRVLLRVSLRLALAVASLLIAAGTAQASILSLQPSGTAPWVLTAKEPAKVQSAITTYRAKLAREFESRLEHVQADGRLRVMVATTSRSATVRDFVIRTTGSATWYPGMDAFLGTVTPDQLASLLASPHVAFVDPDYPLTYTLADSAYDIRARAHTALPSVLPDGSEEGSVSLAQPSIAWSGDAPGNTINIANILTPLAGARPVCVAPTCDTFKLHVTDQGDLTVRAVSGTRLVAVEVEKPDGQALMSNGEGTNGTAVTLEHAEPGDYVVRVWVNVIGASAAYTASARLDAPDGSGPDGIWGFDPSAGELGALRSADRHLDAATATGRGVTVAIIDSGIDNTHRDFGGFDCEAGPYAPCESRIKAATTVSQIAGGPELGMDIPTTEAASGHGTHVAGIVAGNGYMARDAAGGTSPTSTVMNGPGTPIGVAPEASLVSIKNGDTLWAGMSTFGLAWVAENAQRLGIRVLNNSWGCLTGCAYSPQSPTTDVKKRLYDRGVLVTFAAGNGGGTDSGSAFSGDSQNPYTLSVANYEVANHRLASSSSRGQAANSALPDPATWNPDDENNAAKHPARSYRRPDIGAPGTNIWAARTLTGGAASTVPRVDTADATGGTGSGTSGYTQMSGTSMAAPHVAGGAALLFSACPAARVLDVMRALMAGANPTLVATTDGSRVATAWEMGYGAMDVRASLDWLRANVPACSVNTAPSAAIAAPADGLEGDALTFDGTGSADAEGPISAYRWNFGDGTAAEGATVQHAYAEPGTYTVTLSVTDGDGVTSGATHVVTVAAQPDPDPSTPTIQSAQPVDDTAQASGGWRYYKLRVPAGKGGLDVVLDGENCTKKSCKPDLDLYVRSAAKPAADAFACKAATTGSDERCAITDPSGGYWYVGVLTAVGKEAAPFRLTATVTDKVVEEVPNAAPTARISATCLELACSFTDASTDTDGTITSRAWDFGDGATATGAGASHTYAAPGSYPVRLTVTDDDGATSTATETVVVDVAPDPDPTTPTLESGAARSDQNGPSGSWAYYKVLVPEGASTLTVDLAGQQTCLAIVTGCSPDLDLHVRSGQKPTTTTFDCAPAEGDINETCAVAAPRAGWWYVGVYTYSGGFQGLTPEEQVTYTVTAAIG